MATIKNVMTIVVVLVLAVIIGAAGLLGCRIANYMNRGFTFANACEWTMADAEYSVRKLIGTKDKTDETVWYGAYNENILDYNYMHFYE